MSFFDKKVAKTKEKYSVRYKSKREEDIAKSKELLKKWNIKEAFKEYLETRANF